MGSRRQRQQGIEGRRVASRPQLRREIRRREARARSSQAPSDGRRRRFPAPRAGKSSRRGARRALRNRSAAPVARKCRICGSHLASLPCGMAMPSPTPVDPRRSRWRSESKISRADSPDTRAARSLISCNACFLPLTRRDGMIASGVRRSVRGISNSKVRTCRRGRTSWATLRAPTFAGLRPNADRASRSRRRLGDRRRSLERSRHAETPRAGRR